MRRLTLTPFARVPVCSQRAVLEFVIFQVNNTTDMSVGRTGSLSALGNLDFALRRWKTSGENVFVRERIRFAVLVVAVRHIGSAQVADAIGPPRRTHAIRNIGTWTIALSMR